MIRYNQNDLRHHIDSLRDRIRIHAPKMTQNGGRIRSSPWINLIMNLDRPRIYNAAADAVLRPLKECVSIAQKCVA